MDIDFIGDGEYFETELIRPPYSETINGREVIFPDRGVKIKIKPTLKLLELLKFLEEIKKSHDNIDPHWKDPKNYLTATIKDNKHE